MRWVDGAGHAVVSHFGNLLHLRFAESGCIGGDDTDRRGLSDILCNAPAGAVGFDDVDKTSAVRGPSAGDDLAGFVMDDVTDTIHRHKRADDETIRQFDAGGADP